jgi:hypothetical protein
LDIALNLGTVGLLQPGDLCFGVIERGLRLRELPDDDLFEDK